MRQVSGSYHRPGPSVELATDDQRARLVASPLTEIHVDQRLIAAIRPRLALRAYFRELIEADARRERETGVSRASTTPTNHTQITYRLAATA